MAIKIKMVVGMFHPFGSGAERQAEHLSIELQNMGAEVEVVTLHSRGTPAVLDDDPVKVTRLNCPGFWRFKGWMFVWKAYRYLLRTKDETDIIHIHQAEALAAGAVLAAKKAGIPSLIKCGNSGVRFDLAMTAKKYFFGKKLSDTIATLGDKFIALNPQISDELCAWGVGKEKIANIPNGVVIKERVTPCDKIQARKELGISEDARLILAVGTLSPKKDYPTLIRSLAKMSAPAELLVLGKGAKLESLKNLAASCGVSERVNFAGEVGKNEVGKYLAAADIYALSSRTEGVPNSLLEAMCASLPSVVSDIPGNRVLVRDNESGIICPVGDAESFATGFDKLFADKELRAAMASKAREITEAEFDIRLIAARYMKLYEEMLK